LQHDGVNTLKEAELRRIAFVRMNWLFALGVVLPLVSVAVEPVASGTAGSTAWTMARSIAAAMYSERPGLEGAA
jgi:hypothetical protein